MSQDNYSLHHITTVKKTNKQKSHIDNILATIKSKSNIKGVVLYFHGGLSSTNYMEDTLGPALMESLFTETNLTNDSGGLYPVFMNYKAGIFENKDLYQLLLKYITKKKFEKAKKKFEKVFFSDTKLLKTVPQKQAKLMIQNSFRTYTKSKTLTLSDENILEILKEEQLQEELGKSLIQNHLELNETAQIINQGKTEQKGLWLNTKILAAIARTIARIAIGNNHEILPTFEEEIFRYFGIQDIAANHWNNVKKKSNRSFQKDYSGKYFIDELLKIQQEKEGNNQTFTINTLSHSAGSIPTGVMTQYLTNKEKMLDNVIMIVPAINQGDFHKYIVQNHQNINNLKLYVLRSEAEKKDDVLKVYTASLLYFVSGSAEDVWYGDKMLLIGQHLQKNLKPYSSKTYRKILGGKDKKAVPLVWDFFGENESVLSFYPFKTSDAIKNIHSHECTKYPWRTKDLAKKILKQIHNEDIPDGYKIEEPSDEDLVKKCKNT